MTRPHGLYHCLVEGIRQMETSKQLARPDFLPFGADSFV